MLIIHNNHEEGFTVRHTPETVHIITMGQTIHVQQSAGEKGSDGLPENMKLEAHQVEIIADGQTGHVVIRADGCEGIRLPLEKFLKAAQVVGEVFGE